MLYKFVGGATLVIASLSILAQIVLLPLIFQYSVNIKNDFQARMRNFHYNARKFDNQVNHIRKLDGGTIGIKTDQHHRFARQLAHGGNCPPPHPGPPGSPGDPAPDGEPGDSGNDGASGIDAYQLLLEEAQKCVECPAGPIGPMGAPGAQGFTGHKGDRGEPGSPGKDGVDGEQGEEGFSGRRGLAGKPGRKGPDGMPAPGGQGPPGLLGVKGPVGPTGAQGERGKRNYVIGPPGADGRAGKAGMDGIEGKAGQRGEKGEKGEPGANAQFCPCPIELSNGKDKQKSHLNHLDAKPLAFASRSFASQSAENPKERMANNNLATPPPTPPTPTIEKENQESLKLEIQPLPPAERKSPLSSLTNTAPAFHNNQQAARLDARPPAPARSPGVGGSTHVSPNLAYEDVYPNYDGEKKSRASGSAPGTTTNKEYDEDTPDSSANESKGAVDGENVEREASTHDGHSGDEENVDLRELGSQDANQPETGSQRRFVYVTKRPRPN